MAWRGRDVAIVVSLGLHVLVGAIALGAAHEKKARRATTVALAEEKKKEQAKKPEPPKPPPVAKPKPAAPKPAAAPAPAPAPAATAPAPSAPISTDIGMSNEVGMDMGTGQHGHAEQKALPTVEKKPKPAAAPTDKPLHVDTPPPTAGDAGACTEPPGKPEPSAKTEIEYTEEARAAGIEGRLVLEVTVDADGNVTDVAVVNGVDVALDAAAIATVKTWRFRPALACGKPVAGGKYKIARRFELSD